VSVPNVQSVADTRRYWKSKEEALDHTVWNTLCGQGYGPVVR